MIRYASIVLLTLAALISTVNAAEKQSDAEKLAEGPKELGSCKSKVQR